MKRVLVSLIVGALVALAAVYLFYGVLLTAFVKALNGGQ